MAEAMPVVEPAGPASPMIVRPDWRATLRRSLCCCFGGVVLIAALGPLFVLGDLSSMLVLAGLLAAAALLSTLIALVIESLSGRTVPIGGHVLLAALGLGIVVALMTVSLGWSAIGALVGGASAALGALLTAGRPTWRRFLITLVVAVGIGVVGALIVS